MKSCKLLSRLARRRLVLGLTTRITNIVGLMPHAVALILHSSRLLPRHGGGSKGGSLRRQYC